MAASGLRERNRHAAMAEVQRAAVPMMRSVGFGNVTVEQVAEAAGVSPSTVYRYFGTKEALILWGDRSARLVAAFRGSPVAKKSTAHDNFVAAATSTYGADVDDLLAQLRLVFANDELAIAFEHQLLGCRREIADGFAEQRGAASRGVRDDAAAGAHLGMLVSILDRWQAGDGQKSLPKMITKAAETLGG